MGLAFHFICNTIMYVYTHTHEMEIYGLICGAEICKVELSLVLLLLKYCRTSVHPVCLYM